MKKVWILIFIVLNLTMVSLAYVEEKILTDSSHVNDKINRTSLFNSSWYSFNPISDITLRLYYLNSRYPSKYYLLTNSDGEKIERFWTPFFSLDGGGDLFSRLSFYYKVHGYGRGPITLKRGSLSYSNWGISLELARGTVWTGPGYHGSLLLSNNAEPFPFVKFQTVEPFRIPYLGKFSYKIFHGWPQDFKILGHRLGYIPISWIELGFNQHIIYTMNYKVWEFFRIITASEANVPSKYNNDFRASMELVVNIPFIRDVLQPLIDGKFYYEYAGEDIFAWWQKEEYEKVWVGPLGFDFHNTGHTMGFWLAMENDELRVEYSENFRNRYLFHSFKKHHWYLEHTRLWYGRGREGFGNRNPPFLNGDALMGHHMGTQSDDFFIEFTHYWSNRWLKLFYNHERRGLVTHEKEDIWPPAKRANPEHVYRYGVEFSISLQPLNLACGFLWNQYLNVDGDIDPLEVTPIPRLAVNEYIYNFTIKYHLGAKSE